MKTLSNSKLSKIIDHTLLKADATSDAIDQLCKEAIEYDFATVCVNGSFVAQAAKKLAGSSVKAITVVGFPLGAMSTKAKLKEAECALEDGAGELDVVLHIGQLKSKNYSYIEKELQAFRKATGKTPIKLILETALLNSAEKIMVCRFARDAGFDFVKTSTGFAGGGATTADIELMRNTVGPGVGVKASGGIRSTKEALEMIAAGATRLGTSASISIVTGSTEGKQNGY